MYIYLKVQVFKQFFMCICSNSLLNRNNQHALSSKTPLNWIFPQMINVQPWLRLNSIIKATHRNSKTLLWPECKIFSSLILFFCLSPAIFQIIQSIRMGMWDERSSAVYSSLSSPFFFLACLKITRPFHFSYLIFIRLKGFFFHHNTQSPVPYSKSWRNVIFWNIPVWDFY